MKKLLIFIFLLNICDKSNAQKYMYGLGSNISLLTADINTPSEQYNFVMAVTHFSYTPRFILSGGDNSSLTVGFPMGAGIGFLTSAGNATGIAWGADAPVAFDYNMGNMSTPENEKKFGWYIGGGFGYMYTGYRVDGETESINTYGPIGRLGIRFGSNWRTTVGLFYKHGLDADKFKTFGFNILMEK